MRIAFVEDNEVFQLYYKEWLGALYPDAVVDGFEDASEDTKRALLTGKYTLILLDVQLGEKKLGGRSLAEALHKAPYARPTDRPIVLVLTATIEPERVPDILKLGVNAVRGKPLSREEMRDVLAKVNALRPADLSINMNALKHNVTRGGKQTTLSPIPLRILQRLVSTPGELVRFAEIRRALGKSESLTKESIQQHIAAIRLGLRDLYSDADLAANPMLVAEPGLGYRWEGKAGETS